MVVLAKAGSQEPGSKGCPKHGEGLVDGNIGSCKLRAHDHDQVPLEKVGLVEAEGACGMTAKGQTAHALHANKSGSSPASPLPLAAVTATRLRLEGDLPDRRDLQISGHSPRADSRQTEKYPMISMV